MPVATANNQNISPQQSYVMRASEVTQEKLRQIGYKKNEFLNISKITKEEALEKQKWDKMEAEADEAIAKGEYSGPFDNIEDLLADLNS